MELTPKFLIEDVDFPIVRKGYDPDQVDTFLELVAGGVAQMQRQIAAAQERAERAEARRPADDGPPQPPPMQQPQHQPQPAQAPATFGTEEIQRTLVLAQRTADAAIREARDEAERTLGEARNEATRLLESTRAEAARRDEEALLRLQTEVEELHRVRETMTGDIAVLERHAEQQRARLRWSVTELKRLLDDPAAFRVQGVPKGLSNQPEKAALRATPAPSIAPVADNRPKARVQENDAVIDLVDSPPPASVGPQGHSNGNSRAPQGNGNGNSSVPAGPPQQGGAVFGSQNGGMGSPSTVGPPPMAMGSPMPVGPGQDHQSEDAFLTELRKAMTDDEPLGPRYPDDGSGGGGSAYHPDQPQSRFGRRH